MSDIYAVPGEKLEEIAGAIRLKRDITTTMTVDDMPLQIGLIDGGSAGNIAEGEFTTGSTIPNTLSIDHNLNTLRVVVLLYVATEEFKPTGGYQSLWSVFANFAEILPHGYIMDATAYNATRFPEPYAVDPKVNQTGATSGMGGIVRSPWTSQATVYVANTYAAWASNVFTPNSVFPKFIGNFSLAPNTTYHWKVIAV